MAHRFSAVVPLTLLLAGCATPSADVDDREALGRAIDATLPPAPPLPACMGAVVAENATLDEVEINATRNVPASSLVDARTGILGAKRFLAACLGGDLPPAHPVRVEIRSSYNGDERRNPPWEAYANMDGSPGGIIHADAAGRDGYPDEGWSFEVDQQKTFAHEYTHVWHSTIGCAGRHPPVPNWFSEGLADYVGYHQAIAHGAMSRDDARTFNWRAAWSTGELAVPLSDLQIWSGHVGFFAIEGLVSRPGESPGSLREMCAAMNAVENPGASFESAFKATFGLEVAQFVGEFHAAGAARAPPGSGTFK